MNEMVETLIRCPYCDEQIWVMVDDSVAEQQYIEDYQVCCRPMLMSVTVMHDGSVQVQARNENE